MVTLISQPVRYYSVQNVSNLHSTILKTKITTVQQSHQGLLLLDYAVLQYVTVRCIIYWYMFLYRLSYMLCIVWQALCFPTIHSMCDSINRCEESISSVNCQLQKMVLVPFLLHQCQSQVLFTFWQTTLGGVSVILFPDGKSAIPGGKTVHQSTSRKWRLGLTRRQKELLITLTNLLRNPSLRYCKQILIFLCKVANCTDFHYNYHCVELEYLLVSFEG